LIVRSAHPPGAHQGGVDDVDGDDLAGAGEPRVSLVTTDPPKPEVAAPRFIVACPPD
jgi:hypothetical protein